MQGELEKSTDRYERELQKPNPLKEEIEVLEHNYNWLTDRIERFCSHPANSGRNALSRQQE
jgi:hypothetical protein